MVPFPLLGLLLLLLRESQAENVCVRISDHKITINRAGKNITDGVPHIVTCDESECSFHCTKTKEKFKSYICFKAIISYGNETKEYYLEDYANCTEIPCNGHSVLPLIQPLGCGNCGRKEMAQLVQMRISCEQLFSSHPEIKIHYLKAEKQIIHNFLGTSNVMAGTFKNYNLSPFSLRVFNISLNSSAEGRIKIDAPQLLSEDKLFIPEVHLPVNALRKIPRDQMKIGLVTYQEHKQFQFEQEEFLSMVLRIELLGQQRLRNLTSPIEMIFNLTTHTVVDNYKILCHYFDKNAALWKPDGCETNTFHMNQTTCYCDHTTAFAVLLVRIPIDEIHWKILSIISYIGCGLSAFFTGLSLVIYVFSRHHKLDYSISIHVSLSGALFLLNTTFLLTEWGAKAQQEWLCEFVAAFMHYSLLCCFTWMAIEAVHLYLLLIKVFNTYYKHYLLKLSLAGWGIPGIVVAVSVGVKDFKQFYGVTEIGMADTNQTSAICWITDDSFFYSLNLVYFTFIFVFNSGILMAVATRIRGMKLVKYSKLREDQKRFRASCRSGLTVLGITCLLGTTWGLAFLGSGYVNYPILYLFCILNSAQGFLIFLWICLSAQRQRKRNMEEKMSSTPVRNTGLKSD